MSPEKKIDKFRETYDALREEIGKIIVGQAAIVDGTLNALFANGHVLLEGVPGLGKTLLVRTLSQVLDLSFNRIAEMEGLDALAQLRELKLYHCRLEAVENLVHPFLELRVAVIPEGRLVLEGRNGVEGLQDILLRG